MESLIQHFGDQLSEAIQIGINYKFKSNSSSSEINNVIITGLGGSGIGGTFIQNYTHDTITVPVVVNKSYFLPAFVNEHTLVIVCSYSGNTEETVQALKQALAQGAKIACITSGGKIAALAAEHHLDAIIIPGGNPPRSALGYSIVGLLFTLHHYGFIDDSFRTELTEASQLLAQEQPDIRKQALAFAGQWAHKIPVFYIDNKMEAVAVRWRQQFNENGKMLCWSNVLPEMNHNELVGWREKNDDLEVIFLRNDTDYERVQARIAVIKTIIASYAHVTEIYSKGKSFWAKAFYLVHLGDWISFYLSQERGFDVTEVKVIDHLKAELAKL